MRVLPIIATYVLGAALLLACQANVADLKNANQQSEDFTDALKIYTSRGPIYTSNFSTNDKPKMSFSTPSGNRMIYNPAEDPEFIQKLDLYRIPCEDGDEEACFNAGKYVEYFMLLQNLDIFASGCSGFKRTNLVNVYIISKDKNSNVPPYPEGYFNPYKNHDYVSGHFLPKWDKDKKSEYIEINERQFTKTRSTKITSSYFTSEVLELAEIFEFECLIWTSFEVLLENFTTIGKPTQTVETPLGPKEIYDPVQDKDVRAAFKMGYDQNDPMFQPRYTSDPKYSPQVYILKRAMFEQVNAYEDLSCSRVETSDCNVSFVYDCKRNQSCKYTAISTGPGMQVCGVGNQRAYNISAFRIGKHSHDNWPHLTQEEQLKNLFLVNCKSYAE